MNPQSVPPFMRRAAHTVSVSTGRVTHQVRMLPGFLIVGAQRGGTTSMYRTLRTLRATLNAHFLPWDERLADRLGQPPSWR